MKQAIVPPHSFNKIHKTKTIKISPKSMRDEDITVARDGARRGRREGPDCVSEFRGCKEGFDGFVSGP